MTCDTARLPVAGNCPFSDSTRALARVVASKLVCIVACRVLMVELTHPHCSLFLSDLVFRPIPMILSLSLSSVQGCCRIFSGSHRAAPFVCRLDLFIFSIAQLLTCFCFALLGFALASLFCFHIVALACICFGLACGIFDRCVPTSAFAYLTQTQPTLIVQLYCSIASLSG